MEVETPPEYQRWQNAVCQSGLDITHARDVNWLAERNETNRVHLKCQGGDDSEHAKQTKEYAGLVRWAAAKRQS